MACLLTGFESGPRVREACLWAVCDCWPQPDLSQILRFLNTKNNYNQNYLNSIASLAPAGHPLARFPSASAFLVEVYLPELRRIGVCRHPDCTATPESMDPAEPARDCSLLFPPAIPLPGPSRAP